jgi:hypothetical protein
MPTQVATPNDVAKVQAQVTALAEKHATLEAATASAFSANAETEARQDRAIAESGKAAFAHADAIAALVKRVEDLEARPVYVPPLAPTAPPAVPLSRIADRILGMQIGAKNYDDPLYQERIAKLAVAVLAFPKGWKGDVNGNMIRPCVQAIKARGPVKIAQYSNFVECLDNVGQWESSGDIARKLHAEGWWLRTVEGALLPSRIQTGKHDVNITDYVATDADGLRFPQWHARRDHALFFGQMPEFDIWYLDNCNEDSRQWGAANWRLDGVNVNAEADASMHVPWRKAMRAWWDECRRLAPGLTIFGNPDHDLRHQELAGALDGAFLENLQNRDGGKWASVWARYTGAMKNVINPAQVAFHVTASQQDATFWLCASLLGDGMFSLTEPGVGYSSVPWLDEYEIRLGSAVEPTPAFENVMTRRYQGGVVALNAGVSEATITLSDFGAVSLPPKTGRIFTA